jgi:beta-galactosidase
MRTIKNVNENWYFSKNCTEVPSSLPLEWEIVNLPHTWNNADGQDGGNDYYKGACYYVKKLIKPVGDKIYLEFMAAANVATIYINGCQVAYHEGGYSTFRVNIAEKLQEGENLLVVCVDNSPKDNIYPQMADFTFYGGLYRDVNLITVSSTHFDLDYFGGNGLTVSSEIIKDDAVLTMNAVIENPVDGQFVEFYVRDVNGTIVASTSCPVEEEVETKVLIQNVHLWQGVKDPYLYTVNAILVIHNEVFDEVSTKFGVREFHVDPQQGFFLNGVLTPLRGVSRHQDRLGIGNALTKEQHYDDMKLIREVGANTVRLAHYQHDRYFYDACDEAGVVVWAEIPFISVMSANPAAHDNCISQMKELIIQNYNHPSICFWGIANEITIGGERPGLLENLKDLDRLVHELDKTRLSTIAQVSMVPMESPMNHITDVVSYNHYFGWYGGTMEQNEVWVDAFHAMHPDRALGISEYGAEGIITYHSDEPKVKDYSEDYQALYHEHMAQIIADRPWLWATHVWNMFDFGCDARDEGGVKGRNNKGLVTLDRIIKKDSFYVYKAFWSEESFVHISGRRYAMRMDETTTIKVYSNLPEVSLYVNGELFETKEGSRIFIFENVPLVDGYTLISAKALESSDSITLQKTEAQNPEYICPQDEEDGDGAPNWFTTVDFNDVKPLEFREGYFSIKDTMGEILENEEAGTILAQAISAITGIKLKKSMLGMMKDMTLEGMTGLMSGMAVGQSDKAGDMLLILNDILNKIKK